jgi:hypothetical protein
MQTFLNDRLARTVLVAALLVGGVLFGVSGLSDLLLSNRAASDVPARVTIDVPEVDGLRRYVAERRLDSPPDSIKTQDGSADLRIIRDSLSRFGQLITVASAVTLVGGALQDQIRSASDGLAQAQVALSRAEARDQLLTRSTLTQGDWRSIEEQVAKVPATYTTELPRPPGDVSSILQLRGTIELVVAGGMLLGAALLIGAGLATPRKTD